MYGLYRGYIFCLKGSSDYIYIYIYIESVQGLYRD